MRLADRLGATIDTTASLGHAPSVMAIQQAGESTCTLGEIKNRADLVIFWGSDPVETHPRHLERYSTRATRNVAPLTPSRALPLNGGGGETRRHTRSRTIAMPWPTPIHIVQSA